MRRDFRQRTSRAIVALNGDDSRRAKRQKRAREPARPRTDFDYGDCLERSRGAGDPRGEIEIEQEVLAERFSRGQAVAANNLAERRQPVD